MCGRLAGSPPRPWGGNVLARASTIWAPTFGRTAPGRLSLREDALDSPISNEKTSLQAPARRAPGDAAATLLPAGLAARALVDGARHSALASH